MGVVVELIEQARMPSQQTISPYHPLRLTTVLRALTCRWRIAGLRRLRMKLVRWLRGEGEYVHASVGEQSFIRNAGPVNCLHFKRVRAAARAACANLIVWDGRPDPT